MRDKCDCLATQANSCNCYKKGYSDAYNVGWGTGYEIGCSGWIENDQIHIKIIAETLIKLLKEANISLKDVEHYEIKVVKKSAVEEINFKIRGN